MRNWVLAVLAVVSCTEKSEQAKAPTATLGPVGPVGLVGPPPPSSSVAAVIPATPGLATGIPGAIVAIEILADNTVAISTATTVHTIDASGTARRAPLKPDSTVKLDPMQHGTAIVVENMATATILKSPTLEELWSGSGQAIAKPHGAVATPSGTLHFLVGSTLTKLDLPPGPTKKIDTVEVTASKKLGIVTYSVDFADPVAQVFDLAANKAIGPAEPMPSFSYPTRAILVGDTQWALANGNAMEIDLATGRTRKQKVCSSLSFGNVMFSPAGDFLLITCGDDGLALDPKTFAVKRRYTKILPGCDNGDTLPAHFDSKKKTELIIEGCGGQARLDTTTAKYRCADSKELVGAPYSGMSPHSAQRANIPADRLHLPTCSPPGTPMRSYLGGEMTGTYYEDGTDDKYEVVGPSGRITIDNGASGLVISADETRLAYELKDRVVVRSLPDGKVVAELRR